MFLVMKEHFAVRPDTGMRMLAGAGIAIELLLAWSWWKAGWGGLAPLFVFCVAIPILGLMAAGAWSWPSFIDASRALRTKGPTQGRIPLDAIKAIRREGDLVLIDWLDRGRPRVKRILPKEPDRFVEWLRRRAAS